MPLWLLILTLGASFLLGGWLGTRRRRGRTPDLHLVRVKYVGNERANYRIICRLCDAKWTLVNVDIHRLDRVSTQCIRCGATETLAALQRALRTTLRVSLDDPPRHIKIREPQ